MASLDPYQTFVDFLIILFSFRAMAGMDSKVLMGEDLHTQAITSRYRTIGDTNDVEATMMTLLSWWYCTIYMLWLTRVRAAMDQQVEATILLVEIVTMEIIQEVRAVVNICHIGVKCPY